MRNKLIRMLTAGLLISGLALAALPTSPVSAAVIPVLPPFACTIIGTNAGESMQGTAASDSVCGRGGADTIDIGVGGNLDRARGGAGADVLYSIDGNAGDRLNGGKGVDVCWIDFGDLVAQNCETINID